MGKLKTFLVLMIATGAAALFAGSGTFASFSAETTNAGGSVASGTLTMSNTVNGGTACLSMNAVATANLNPNCSAPITLSNVAPGVFGGTAQIAVANTGSLDASKLSLWSPWPNATLSLGAGTLSTSINTTSLTITGLEGAVATGNTLMLTYGTHTDTFTASAPAAGGATSISVTGKIANFAYPTGTVVTNTSGNTTATNSDCYDALTTAPGTAGATKGTDLNFNSITGNPMCGTLLLFVQETTNGQYYCWAGKGSSPENAVGQCTAPISVTLSSGLTSGVSVPSLSVSALNGNVASGDSIVVRNGSSTQTFTASTNVYFGATSIPVTPVNANANYPTTSTVTDSTTLGTLNSDSTDTVTNFNTLHNASVGKIPMPPISSNGNLDMLNPVQLSHYNSGTFTRTFQIGVYLPAPNGINQNTLQGLVSTFGLTWHIDQ